MHPDDVTIIVLWALWGTGCAALWRYVLPRFVFRFSNKLVALALTYSAMVAFFFGSIAILDWSGWNFKGSNGEPAQEFAELLFFFTPFGLPLLLGGPIVLFFDIVIFLKRRFPEVAP